MRIQCRECNGSGDVYTRSREASWYGPAEWDPETCGHCWGDGEREETDAERGVRVALTQLIPARCEECGGRVEVRHDPFGTPYGWCDLDGPVYEPCVDDLPRPVTVRQRQRRLPFAI